MRKLAWRKGVKMFRLLFALILAVIFRSLANAQNKSTVKVSLKSKGWRTFLTSICSLLDFTAYSFIFNCNILTILELRLRCFKNTRIWFQSVDIIILFFRFLTTRQGEISAKSPSRRNVAMVATVRTEIIASEVLCIFHTILCFRIYNNFFLTLGRDGRDGQNGKKQLCNNFHFGRRPPLIVRKPATTIIRVVVKTSFTAVEQLILKIILQVQIK